MAEEARKEENIEKLEGKTREKRAKKREQKSKEVKKEEETGES